MDIFAKGTRARIRFDFSAGQISIETLWGLKTPQIKSILLDLKELIEKKSSSQSFLEEIDAFDLGRKDSELELLQLKFDIALEIYKTLVGEKKQIENATNVERERVYWSELLLQKQREEDRNLSVESVAEKLKEIDSKLVSEVSWKKEK